ncbi:MAG: C10 family peptidase, partial [Muribaculaceae bacterium]|nr:C10 family peptidase [Muribaculaceae bacterium]
MKRLFLAAAAVMAAFGASAELLGPAAALDRALEQVPATAAVRRAMRGSVAAAQPLMTVAEHSAEAELYVFAQSGELLLVSAESETPALLGYSDSYVEDAPMPDALKMMIRAYATEIAATRAGNVVMGAPAAGSRADFASISPICKTQWNQNSPYNDLAPKIGDAQTYSGCVATAMSQVLKVMEYPAKCSGGTFTYDWANGGKKLSLNFDDVTLEWDKMLDTYKSSSPAESRNAVAVLMNACAIAAKMNFGTDGSGAQSFEMGTGLIRNFNFDPTLSSLSRDWFSIARWNEMVYNELAAGRAVYYSGATINNEGHAFVVDGYRSDGYFHVNWGWGGLSDGYFLLTALDPEAQGIGGSTGGFDLGQDAFFNLKPNTGIATSNVPLIFFSQDAFAVKSSSVSLGGSIAITLTAFNGRNFSVSKVSPA